MYQRSESFFYDVAETLFGEQPVLRTVTELKRYTIGATDGTIGSVEDLYFDDQMWVIRYLVVATGEWLSSRRVLISPISIRNANWAERILPVSITRDQVTSSPDIDTDKPVSQQHEMHYLGYHGYPYNCGGSGLWGIQPTPGIMASHLGYGATNPADRRAQAERSRSEAEADAERHARDDHHLRSCITVMTYHLHASDGDIGHVQDFLVDEASWAIKYMIVKTSSWWIGQQVLIAPQWIVGFHWDDNFVVVDLTRDAVKNAPPYKLGIQVDRCSRLSRDSPPGGTA